MALRWSGGRIWERRESEGESGGRLGRKAGEDRRRESLEKGGRAREGEAGGWQGRQIRIKTDRNRRRNTRQREKEC